MKVKISFGGKPKEFKLLGEADMTKLPNIVKCGTIRILYLQGPRGASYHLDIRHTGTCSFMDMNSAKTTWLSLNQVEFIEEN
jgi:hypothetical protein